MSDAQKNASQPHSRKGGESGVEADGIAFEEGRREGEGLYYEVFQFMLRWLGERRLVDLDAADGVTLDDIERAMMRLNPSATEGTVVEAIALLEPLRDALAHCTEGPWSATHGTKLVSAPPSRGHLTVAKASVGTSRSADGFFQIDAREAAANARLIAALPDLIAFVQRAALTPPAGEGTGVEESGDLWNAVLKSIATAHDERVAAEKAAQAWMQATATATDLEAARDRQAPRYSFEEMIEAFVAGWESDK